MNPILTIVPSSASELLSRQRNNHRKEQLPALARVPEREHQAKQSEAAKTTATKKTRHQRYVSESYFADDDLTEATVESDLSWYFDSLANVGSERSLHSNRVRTYTLNEHEIECILAASINSMGFFSSSSSIPFFEEEAERRQEGDEVDEEEFTSSDDSTSLCRQYLQREEVL